MPSIGSIIGFIFIMIIILYFVTFTIFKQVFNSSIINNPDGTKKIEVDAIDVAIKYVAIPSIIITSVAGYFIASKLF